MISSSELLKIANDLQRHSSDVWRLVRFKANYGKSWCVLGKSYEEALEDSLSRLEAALVRSGTVGLEIEKQNLFDRSLARIGSN